MSHISGARGSEGAERRQRGFTLIELMVAGTLLAVLVMGISASASVTSTFLSATADRSTRVVELNVLRARLLADAEASTRAFCSGSDTIVFRDESTIPETNIEYEVIDGTLERWKNPPDRSRTIVDEAMSLACTSLGSEGVEIEIALGHHETTSHLYLIYAEETGS